jgi:hypothetical protein
MFVNNGHLLFGTWCIFLVQNSSVQPLDRQTLSLQSQSTATSVANTVIIIQDQPSSSATIQQSRKRVGKHT